MPAIVGHVNFNPDKEIPSLEGKVIFVTGGMPFPSSCIILNNSAYTYLFTRYCRNRRLNYPPLRRP